MMYKKILLLALGFSMTGTKAHDFANTYGSTVLASFDLSGTELWYGYFLPENRLLALRLSDSQRDFKYINHPPYPQQELPEHRMVCELERQGDNDPQNRCKDEFPHVHVDDFKLALDFANDMCEAYGPTVLPDFEEPATFVGVDKAPASSHHYYYDLSQGLKFNCVVLATE